MLNESNNNSIRILNRKFMTQNFHEYEGKYVGRLNYQKILENICLTNSLQLKFIK